MLDLKKNINIIGLLLVLQLYFYHNEHIKKADYAFYDIITMLASKLEPHDKSSYTVIIDIDEKSLLDLGQWPWPRIIDAQLINTLYKMSPSAIGMNILFPESDRLSPISIQKFYKNFFDLDVKFRDFPKGLKNNDNLLFNAIKKSEATIATYLSNDLYSASHCQELSYQQNIFSTIETDYTATSLLCNHPSIQKNIKNFGFINAWTDSDGKFRRVPLFISYQKQIFPSFALATLLSFDKNIEINKRNPSLLLNFNQTKATLFSAVDILNGTVTKDKIQGKIVIIGSSVAGLSPNYILANGEEISNNQIHASVIENILNHSFLTQPVFYKQLNIFFSFLISIMTIFFFEQKKYLNIIALFFIGIAITLLSLTISYMNNIYISIGYFWAPSFYIFIFILIYHIKRISKERQEQEKMLIKKSKLASMGEMITLIAHQWRQPLSTINGIVLNIDIDERKQILQRERLDEHLNQIEEVTAYLSKTIHDFTDFFSTNKEKEKFYISELIKQIKTLSPLNKEDNINIKDISKKDIEIISYKSELLQSILIIVNNAIYACKENLHSTKQGQITIHTHLFKKQLYITIQDNGGGIKKKDLKKLFNPYFTTKEKHHGTGLGLYILKLIVEDSLNGKITIENNNEGAVFTIKIPVK